MAGAATWPRILKVQEDKARLAPHYVEFFILYNTESQFSDHQDTWVDSTLFLGKQVSIYAQTLITGILRACYPVEGFE